jgi:lysozyme
MTMRMSAGGRALLTRREGFKTRAYRDSVGVWTIGVGHTAAAGAPIPRAGMTISKAQVDEILSRDLVDYETIVRSAVKVPLTQGQFDALVSFCFNIGNKNHKFERSTVVKRLNDGDYEGAAAALMMWIKPPEIKGRRDSERRQFLAATGGVGADAAKIVRATEVAPRALAAPVDLQEDESISVDYLRAAGSRTIAGANMIVGVAKKVIAGDVVGAIVQAPDALQQAQDAYTGFQHGAQVLELLRNYWPIPVGLLAAVLIAYLAWRAIKAADKIAMARVDDAVSGINIGR